LYHEDIKVIFNCPNTPPFNIIENVFADLKFHLRKKNLTKREDLVHEARLFLSTLDTNYMKKRMQWACKYFIKAI